MKICIGIVSYLPESKIWEERLAAINSLLTDCSHYFPNIDIIIIAQNYKDYIPKSENNKIILYNYKEKLGILGARKKLREIFINSDYDYLIMFDDDTHILGPIKNNFIETLENNPDKFVCFDWDRGQLWLFAISKSLFKRIEYPESDPELGGVFEDIYLSRICKYLCPEYIDSSKININRVQSRINSTWWDDKIYNIRTMVKNTENLIKNDIKSKFSNNCLN